MKNITVQTKDGKHLRIRSMGRIANLTLMLNS